MHFVSPPALLRRVQENPPVKEFQTRRLTAQRVRIAAIGYLTGNSLQELSHSRRINPYAPMGATLHGGGLGHGEAR